MDKMRGEPDVEGMDVQQLEAEIAALSARIDAAMHRMLVLIRHYDESREWALHGHRSCAAWLSWRTGLAPGAAREHVRVAKALAQLPKTEAALARGDLSFSKVRAITRVGTPEREQRLLDMARFATAQQLERICRGIQQGDRESGARGAGQREAPDRYVVCRPMDDGTVQVIAQLLPDEAEAVRQALHRVREARMPDQQTVEEGPSPGGPDVPAGTPRRVPRAMPSMADALVEVANRVLAGDLDTRGGPPRSAGDRVDIAVVLTRDVLGAGHAAQLDDGTRVPAETFRRLACDAGLVPHLEDAAGQTLDVGRRTRRIPPALRRALRTRQPTCAFPGCDHRRFLDAHHIEHWMDGGETRARLITSDRASRSAAVPDARSTGWTAARPSSTTSSTSAAPTTAWCTKTASPSRWARTAGPSSAPPRADPSSSSRPPHGPAGTRRPKCSTTTARGPTSPSTPRSASPNGKATARTTPSASRGSEGACKSLVQARANGCGQRRLPSDLARQASQVGSSPVLKHLRALSGHVMTKW
jgi:hypothetical protein